MDLSEPDSEIPTSMTLDPSSTTTTTDNFNQEHEPPIMAICTDGSRCGCAIYSDSTIFLVADRKDPNDPYKGLDITIQKINPKVVIVSSVQKRLIDFIEKRFRVDIVEICRSDRRKPNQSQASSARDFQQSTSTSSHNSVLEPGVMCPDNLFTLVTVPNIWFCMSKSIQLLLESEWITSKGLRGLEEKSLFITSKIEKSVDVCAIRAISALNAYKAYAITMTLTHEDNNQTSNTQSTLFLQSNAYRSQQSSQIMREDANNLMPILSIKYVDPGPVLSIDKFTLEALAIFNHPTVKTSSADMPDGESGDIPSLYEVLNQCQSLQGRKQLRTIMLWPLQDINELNHRYDALDYFMRSENKLLIDQLLAHLKNVVPLAALLSKLIQSVVTYKDLSKLYKALWAFIAVIDLIRVNNNHNLEILNRIEQLDLPEFRAVVDSIVNIVDFEASAREKRVQVLLGVDEDVDQKMEIIQNLNKFCDEVAVQETVKYKDTLGKTCRVSYIPRIGFLNSVDFSSTSELLQIRSSKEFEVLLHTEQSVFFKTERMEELDKNAGDIACDLIDVQETVVVNLQDELLKHTELILKFMELCGELDCLIAFARVSYQRGYTRPEFITSDDELDIQQVYHPLHCIKYNVVPNNVRFFNSSAQRRVKLMVLTGPNSCGKTTYMKATCLAIYMAHIGCFVPAKLARIPLIDAILTRLHSANSISTGLSAFATDLHQINYALSRATDRSLIAIDEFGKGTQARDGFYLLKGLVTYFAERTQKSPYVMITTHFNRLINHLQNYSEYILYNTFSVKRDQTKDSIVYEYRLMQGVGEESLADKVAAKAGVPQKIIDRANQIKDHITGGRAIRPKPPCGA